MDETFEIQAIQLAKLVAAGPRKGWLNDAKTLASHLLEKATQTVIPVPLVIDAPKPHSRDRIAVHIRWMIRRDMPEVLEIENHSFPNPWSYDEFIRVLRQRNAIGMIAEFEERVIAFMVYTLAKEYLYVENLAVHADFRWKGVGRQFVEKLQGKLSPLRRNEIRLVVRESNLHAQLFFRATGFKAVKILHDYYDDSEDDGIAMKCQYIEANPEVCEQR